MVGDSTGMAQNDAEAETGLGTGALLCEQVGEVRYLTLNRPEKHNALSGAMMDALGRELTKVAEDPGTSVVVLCGAGASFSSGWDLGEGGGGPMSVAEDRRRLAAAAAHMGRVRACPVPVVAQVHGHCLAGGADLALHCDLLVVAEDARIGYPPVRSLGVPTSHLWLYRAGSQLARWLLFTGDSISGQEAAQRGLALLAVPLKDLQRTARDVATRIALADREMLAANKRVLAYGVDLLGREALHRFAQSEDLLAHLAPAAVAFRARVREVGPSGAFGERDARFEG